MSHAWRPTPSSSLAGNDAGQPSSTRRPPSPQPTPEHASRLPILSYPATAKVSQHNTIGAPARRLRVPPLGGTHRLLASAGVAPRRRHARNTRETREKRWSFGYSSLNSASTASSPGAPADDPSEPAP